MDIELYSIFYSAGKLAGLIGFACLSLLIFSGDTARFFDRFFGMDRIIKFQRKFSVFTTVFILLHPIFFILSSGGLIRPYLVPDFSVPALAFGIMSLYTYLAVMIASQLYKLISYRAWQYIHILTYFLFFFSLFHAVNWGSDSSEWQIIALFNICLAAIVIGLIYRTQYKLRRRHAHRFAVKEITKETPDSFSITLTSDKPYPFQAGQFCFLRLEKERLHARHPFTIASSPQERDLRFIVKFRGAFTKALHELKSGDEVIVDGPFGTFVADASAKKLVFIAGGVGISPFVSIIKDKLSKGDSRPVILLYACRTSSDIICRQELDALKPDWLEIVNVLSNEQTESPMSGCELGYINEIIISKYVSDAASSIFYICGPEPMKKSVVNILKGLGVKNRSIKIEDFFW